MHVKKIKILIYEPYIFKIYGNTRYLLSIFDHYDRSRFEIILAAPYESDFLDMARKRDIQVEVISAPERLRRHGGKILADNIIGRFKTFWGIITYSNKLARRVRELDIDILQCHSIRSLLTSFIAAKKSRIPCFWYVKGALDNPVLDTMGYLIADRVLFQTKTNMNQRYKYLAKLFHNKIRIVPNGIDLEEVQEALNSDKTKLIEELNFSKENLNIAFVGQIGPYKGVHDLIDSLPQLVKSVPKTQLYLIGDSGIDAYKAFEENLLLKIEESKLNSHVNFLGWRKDALDVLALMDIFVLPSYTEGVPKSLLESMALGTCSLATPVGGTTEVLENEQTGFLIPKGSPKSILDKLVYLANNPKEISRISNKARHYALNNFSIQKNIKHVQEIYIELLNKKIRKNPDPQILEKIEACIESWDSSINIKKIHKIVYNYYSICCRVIAENYGEEIDLFLKFPKTNVDDKYNLKPSEADINLALSEFKSLKTLQEKWPKDEKVSFVKPLHYSEITNCIILGFIDGKDFYTILRNAILKTNQNTSILQTKEIKHIKNLGHALRKFHEGQILDENTNPLSKVSEKIISNLNSLSALSTSTKIIKKIRSSLNSMEVPSEGFIFSYSLKGLDIRNAILDKQDRLWLLDPGKIRIEPVEADLARFSATLGILYWGTLSFITQNRKTSELEQFFLESYGDFNTKILKYYLFKEYSKHWLMAYTALRLKPYPSILKKIIAKFYIDRYYSRKLLRILSVEYNELSRRDKAGLHDKTSSLAV